jgi:hypothetical protein
MLDLLNTIWNVNSLQLLLEQEQQLIAPAALEDDYKGLDYGFTDQDFLNALQQTWGAHVKSGIVPYLQNRKTSALAQLNPYMAIANPCTVGIEVLDAPQGQLIFVTDILGRVIDPAAKNCLKILNFENGTQKRVYEME